MANKTKKPNKVGGSNESVALPKTLTKKAVSKTAASAVSKGQTIRNSSLNNNFRTIKDLKDANKTIEAIRRLTDDEALSSFSLFSMVQIADSGITVRAYANGTTELSPEATELVKIILAKIDTLSDYSKGYSDKQSLRSLIHTMLKESPQTGAVCAELVLDQHRLPDRIQVVDYSTIEWIADGTGGRKPRQKVSGGEPISLDIPTFFVSELHKETHEAYAVPLLKSSLDATVANLEFIEDMRRTVNRSGHSRLVVSLDAQKVRDSAPMDTKADENKLATYMENVLSEVKKEMEELAPEDSVVGYDSVEFEVADIGGSKTDYVPMLRNLANYQSTSLKTPPSIIGIRTEGSQSLSNTETLVYLKVVKAIQNPIEEVLSRMLTLAARLYGFDVYCRVEFNDIELRPQGELEAYKVQKQTRNLELLSLGIVSDYQFCTDMGLTYNPAMKPLSGTGFYSSTNKSADPDGGEAEPDNTETDNKGGAESTLNSDAPKKAGGKSQ